MLDNSVIYSSESQIKAKFLITFNVATKEKAVFKNGVLVYSSIFRTINSKTKTNNERLEFLGDAVIQLLMSDYLYKEDLEKWRRIIDGAKSGSIEELEKSKNKFKNNFDSVSPANEGS